MELRDETELRVTREKLRRSEETYERLVREPAESPHVRDLSRQSIGRYINQLKEEIIRYEVRTGSPVSLELIRGRHANPAPILHDGHDDVTETPREVPR